jgi:hypothetical protein
VTLRDVAEVKRRQGLGFLTRPNAQRALEQLEIVATMPAGPSYGDLLLNPCWDSLRGDKRFDKIIAAAKAASR